MNRRVTATFRISSETLGGARIAAALGSTDAEVHNKGDKVSARVTSQHYHKKSSVILHSMLPEEASVAEHVVGLLSRVEPNMSAIAALRDECDVEIWIKISFDSQLGFDLPLAVIERLKTCRTELIFDIYGGG